MISVHSSQGVDVQGGVVMDRQLLSWAMYGCTHRDGSDEVDVKD